MPAASLNVRAAGSSLALPLGSTTRAHHFFCLAEFRDPFSRRCDHFSHHHLFRALRAADRFLFGGSQHGYSLHVHGARSLTLRTRHPSPDHSLYPYPHTDHLCPIFHPSRCPFALRIYQPLASPLELPSLLGGDRRCAKPGQTGSRQPLTSWWVRADSSGSLHPRDREGASHRQNHYI